MTSDEGKSQKTNGYIYDEKECNMLNKGEEDEMEIYGFKECSGYKLATWIFIIFTLGTLRLILHWKPQWMLYLTHKRCSLAEADTVMVVDQYEKRFTSLFIKNVKTIATSSCGIEEGLNKTEPLRCLDPNKLSNVGKMSPIKEFEIHLAGTAITEVTEVRAIWMKKLCYIWDSERKSFLKLVGLDQGVTKVKLHEFHGYDYCEQYKRRIIYGKNEIIVRMQSITTLVLLEVLNPFYIFQLFTICVWFAENYLYYTFAIIIMSLFGISSSVLQTHQNQKNLHHTVYSMDIVTVKRGEEEFEDIPTTQLVPGDVIVIPSHGCTMHCDAALLVGNCIVNESMLTGYNILFKQPELWKKWSKRYERYRLASGLENESDDGESVPVTKTPLPRENALFHENDDANHTLFCGTRVLQTRYYGGERVTAVVLRTGFLTSKGSLVRSILYPPPADFKFDQDSYKFIWILAFIALLGLIYTVVLKSSRGLQPGDIILKALDIITIVIPPALPATMTIGKLYALIRLKKYRISCINSRVINVSGSIDCVCFDKTGTLTEDGLDMWGVVSVTAAQTGTPVRDVSSLPHSPLLFGMACCHSLTMIDGVISGDPLDVKMFESTGWVFEEPEIADTSKYDLMVPTIVFPPAINNHCENKEIGIIHQYQFSSKLQRMSVITRTLGSQDLTVYCKGAPEIIQLLSRPDTVPQNLMSALGEYTEQGYRVIAVGCRTLEENDYVQVQKMPRAEVEKDFEFVGLIIMENRLKPQTTGIISMLKGAQIKVVMVTGDNILTAVSVAKECGIIKAGETVVEVTAEEENNGNPPQIMYSSGGASITRTMQHSYGSIDEVELGCKVTASYRIAITGKSWAVIREHAPELVARIAVQGAVFARMTSDQKQQLVQELQQLGYYVAMCGDGANDCGALKAAHAGISLSEAEASIASPFTSAEANISCVPHIIREGRAALTTSFGVFKFMVLYSIMEFMSTVILYSINSNLTDFEFLFIDLCLVVQLAFSFGRNRAYSGPLVPEVPLTSLLSLIPLSSLLLQAILMSGIQILSFKLVHLYSWFVPFQYKDATYYISYENYAVFTVGQFQYIIMAFVFSQGAPYREPIYTNKIFFTSMCVMTCVCIYITLTPAEWVKNLLQLRFPPNFNFPIVVLGLAFVNFLLSTFVEMFVVQYIMFKKLRYCNHDLKSSRRKYLAVDQELVLDPEWPPLSSGRVTIGLCQEKLEELGTDNPAFEGDVPNHSKHSTNL